MGYNFPITIITISARTEQFGQYQGLNKRSICNSDNLLTLWLFVLLKTGYVTLILD